MQFEGISFLPGKTVTRINFESLRGNLGSHRKSKRRTWSCVISADETATHAAFLEDFWEAELQQISLLESPTASTDSDGINIVTDGGSLPLEYIDGLVHLKEYSFTLQEAQGS